MYPRLVSAAAALVLASAAATALAQSYDGPARPIPAASVEGRVGPRYPAPPSYGPDAVATLRDILVTGSVRTAGDARRGDEAAAR
jgi:hypothetical protein